MEDESNNLEIVTNIKSKLGECPVWDQKNKFLYWVDILGKKIFIYDAISKATSEIALSKYIGALTLCKTGDLLLALQDGFYFLNTKDNRLTKINDPEGSVSYTRFNDGKCDARGRFWAGTTHFNESDPVGSLYCLDTNLKVKKVLKNVIISNGLAWSPDNKKMYYIDTPFKEVYSFDYKINSGSLSNKKVIIRFTESMGYPDGMTIDIDGNLWIAHWGGYKVCQWSPKKGKIIDEIKIPVKRVSCCTFGGDNLDELYITTAEMAFSELNKTLDKKSATEYDGLLFKIKTGTRGLKTNEFGDSG